MKQCKKDGEINGIPMLKSSKGFEKVNEYFVDNSGFGAESEPAMTINNFLSKVRKGFYYAITDAGQFQVFVGEYRRLK